MRGNIAGKIMGFLFLAGAAIMLVLVMILALSQKRVDTPERMEDGTAWFEVVDSETSGLIVYRHRITGVCYLYAAGDGIEIMLDADGKPYTLQETRG